MTARLRSLRARLALWVTVATMSTLLAFAVTAYMLVVAETGEANDEEGQREDREQLLIAMAISAPACLLVSVGGAVFLSRRALAPLDAIIQETRAIGAEDLSRRLPVPERDDELHALTTALNGLLSRLDEGFQALANYAANASHELRTPLAVVTNELEVALRHPRTPDEWRGVAERSLEELRRLTRLVEALLALAREGAGSDVIGAFDIGAAIDHALDACEESARAVGVEVVAPPAQNGEVARGNADLLGGVFEELLRNALRHAPRGGRVLIRCEAIDDGRFAVHVDDDGPGVAPSERASIFTPFVRGSKQRPNGDRTNGVGVGLGLAIAKLGVERCGGEIRVSESPEGGARFTTVLARSSGGSAHMP